MALTSDLLTGIRLHRSGRLIEAEKFYRNALEADPRNGHAYHLLGIAAQDRGHSAEAEQLLRRAIELAPDEARFVSNLGRLLLTIGRMADAEPFLREAARLCPGDCDPLNNLGLALQRLGRLEESIMAFRRAVEVDPLCADAWTKLSCAELEFGRAAEALASAEQGARLEPDSSEAHRARGMAFRELGQYREAVGAFDVALRTGPGNREAELGRALALLSLSELSEGFRALECRRWLRGARYLPGPLWDGSDPKGKTILIYSEGDLADTIQFIRYASHLAALGATVVLETERPLVALLRGTAGLQKVIARGQELPRYDICTPVLSLPGLIKTSLQSIPARIPYLAQDPALVERWHGRFKQIEGLKVGIAWQSDPQASDSHQRTIPLKQFAALAGVPGVRLIGLQNGVLGEADIAMTRLAQLGGDGDDLSDIAAVVHHLDLVVSCDTPIAHVAAALGKRVWLGIRFAACWRWMCGLEDTPWYPTMRLFRQERAGSWTDVLDRMVDAVRQLVAFGADRSGGPAYSSLAVNLNRRGAVILAESQARPPERRDRSSAGSSLPAPADERVHVRSERVFEYFDRAYVLNLDADRNRMIRMAARLRRLGICYERFSAFPAPQGLRSRDSGFRPAYYACGLSHRALLQGAFDCGETQTLIFEDDVLFREDTNHWMRLIVEQLQKIPWDMFYLGLRREKVGESYGPNLVRVERGFHAHAYAVSRKAIPKLVAAIDTVLTRMTGTFDGFQDPTLLKVCSMPVLAIQEPSYSHTHGRWINRLNEHLGPFDAADFFRNCAELCK